MSNPLLQPTLIQSLRAIRVLFFLFGATFAVWATQLPLLKDFYHFDNAQIAWMLFIFTLGAVIGLTQAEFFLHRFGVIKTLRTLWAGVFIGFSLIYLDNTVEYLWCEVLFIGFCSGALDVVINVEATAVEQASKRKLLSGIHGMFSLGGLCGAAFISGLLKLSVPPLLTLIGFGMIGLAVSYRFSCYSVPNLDVTESGRKKFQWPRGWLAALAFILALAMLIEGVVYDWSALLMVEAFATSPSLAAWSYGVFSGAMAIGRFLGDRIRAKWSAQRLLRDTSILAAVSLTLGLSSQLPLLMLVSFAILGLSISNWVPVYYGIAAQGNSRAGTAQAISSLAVVGYIGFLIGPVIIGQAAKTFGLLMTFGGIAFLCLCLAPLNVALLRCQPISVKQNAQALAKIQAD